MARKKQTSERASKDKVRSPRRSSVVAPCEADGPADAESAEGEAADSATSPKSLDLPLQTVVDSEVDHQVATGSGLGEEEQEVVSATSSSLRG